MARPPANDVDDAVARITVEALKKAVLAFEAAAHKEIPLDLHRRMYALALGILDALMGEPWVRANVVGKHGSPDYFRAAADSTERRKNSARVITFAEMLFNLQDVKGFERRLPQLRAGDVESGVAELQAAALLTAAGFQILLREEGYDLDICLLEGDAAVEIKRKLESTKPSIETISSTLKHARRQLPTDRPGFVFLSIPETWIADPAAPGITERALDGVFRNTTRITTVLLWWEDDVPAGEGSWRTISIKEIENPNARFQPGPVKKLAELSWQYQGDWTYLNTLIIDTVPAADDGSVIRIVSRK